MVIIDSYGYHINTYKSNNDNICFCSKDISYVA